MAKVHVLVVDDSVVIRRMLTDTLNSDPAIEVVGHASNGRLALQRLTQLQPDVVVMDVEMPEMNGIEATRILKATPPLSAIPVVVCSSTEREEEALAAGAQEFVRKPVDEDGFLALVQRHVALRVRRDPRRRLDAPCRFTKDGVFHEARTGDVSVTGILLLTGAVLAVGDDLSVAFELPVGSTRREIQAEAMVVRITGGGFGLGFRRITEGDRWFLQEFIAESADD